MKVSVITVSYNAVHTIEDTLKSVLQQDFKNLEYIVIDGASTDGTIALVKKYEDKISRFISEPDKGVYDAMNKGLRLATGHVVAILNADDTYAHPGVLSLVVRTLVDTGAQTCYGDLIYVDRMPPHKTKRTWEAGACSPKAFLNGWMPPHPAFFVKRAVYETYGNFDLRFKTSADYELILRLLYKNKVSTAYVPEVLVKMKVGGQSNISVKNRMRANREDRLAWKVNGLTPGRFTLAKKPLLKIRQFFKR